MVYMANYLLTEFSTIPGLCARMVLIVLNTSAMCSVSKRSWHSISAQNVPVRPIPSLYVIQRYLIIFENLILSNGARVMYLYSTSSQGGPYLQ